ncbi:MAG TPA: response regulator transcription factor [Clostridia bacterium]|nr:response regulator transcription factor [Clostridia bacterium]
MYKILIIEDDQSLQALLKEYLEKYEYKVSTISDFKNIESQLEEINPDLILLDINLPYFDGFYLCRAMRRKSSVPIIIMSARTGEMEQIMGIELGADDYVIKPFNTDILHSKIKAALRRTYGEYSKSDISGFQLNKFSLDDSCFKISYNSVSSELSKNEYKLLKKLLDKKDKIVSREELLEELWDDSSFVDDNTLTVNVTRIKNKLADIGLNDVIKTKRGTGYYFDSALLE